MLSLVILLNINSIYVLASDDDSDGIDDEYESYNYRDLDLELSGSEVRIESIHREDSQKDDIRISIKIESDGLEFEVGYAEDHDSVENEIEFSVTFNKLIEFIDINSDGMFDNISDIFIREILLDDFEPFTYSQTSISEYTHLHHIIANTTDGIFKAHFYICEEFYIINSELITPTQGKIDIEINDFPYFNESSQLALHVKLEAEADYEEEEETEDESLGYSSNENGVKSTNNAFTGFFTWKENATIDGKTERVVASPLVTNEEDQMLYLNYPRAIKIIHDPKIGIEGLLKSITNPPFPYFIMILFLIIGALSIGVAYSVYHYRESIFPSLYLEEMKKQVKEGKKEDVRFGLSNLDLTVISPDFYEIINRFKWDPDEKEIFIKEMLSLTPSERRTILDEILRKSQN